jgi:hypothetical protein
MISCIRIPRGRRTFLTNVVLYEWFFTYSRPGSRFRLLVTCTTAGTPGFTSAVKASKLAVSTSSRTTAGRWSSTRYVRATFRTLRPLTWRA